MCPLAAFRRGLVPLMVPLALSVASLAQTTATIDIDTSATTPIHPKFSGANSEMGSAVEYWDYRFNAMAAAFGFGWVRFPGGSESDIYNWKTGLADANWYTQFSTYTAGPGPNLVQNVAGKGGARFIDAANRANLLGATLIVCVNGFTDTPDSIGQMAAYAKANNISVAAWELANEPYLFSGFFPTSTAYLDKMKPYRDAIKAADPNAIVSVFIRDPGSSSTQNTWNQAVAAYPGKYWDAISFHHYPSQSTGAFSQWIADQTAVLLTDTDMLVTGQLTPIGPSGVSFLVTEFDSSIPNDSKTNAVSITDGSLWGGIYAAEFVMRMSTVPAVLHVGPHSLNSFSGVDATTANVGLVQKAAQAGSSINTLSLDFGFYPSAQANALAVLNSVINNATNSNKTTVNGGASVPATGITAGVPALYAMSYSNAQGGLSIVVANKSATAHQVTLRVNGQAASGSFPLQFVAGADPSTRNSLTAPGAVAVQSGTSANPVTIPGYSVFRVDLTTPPVARIANSASFQSGPVAPVQLVTAFGNGFAAKAIVDATMPTLVGDTTIVITDAKGNSNSAPLYYVSPTQASFLIPQSAAAGIATVKVQRAGVTVLTGTMTIAAVSPGLYTANGNGAGVAAATYVRTSAPNAAALVFTCQSGLALSCLSTPISTGASSDTLYVTLYASGIRGAQNVQVFVAGQSVPVLFAGAQGQYQGLDQINITIPHTLAGTGEASVYVVANGATSNMATINIQ